MEISKFTNTRQQDFIWNGIFFYKEIKFSLSIHVHDETLEQTHGNTE